MAFRHSCGKPANNFGRTCVANVSGSITCQSTSTVTQFAKVRSLRLWTARTAGSLAGTSVRTWPRSEINEARHRVRAVSRVAFSARDAVASVAERRFYGVRETCEADETEKCEHASAGEPLRTMPAGSEDAMSNPWVLRERRCEECGGPFLINGSDGNAVQHQWRCDGCRQRPLPDDGRVVRMNPARTGSLSPSQAERLVSNREGRKQ